jgi:uncharacterized protein (TIGR03437 family)
MVLRLSSLAVASICFCVSTDAAVHPEAGKVLVLVNDVAPPESGTNGKGASVFVGEYYAQQRGVPAGQILHLNIPLGCCENNPTDWDSWNMSWDKFDSTIRQPLKKFLADNQLTQQIDYIVPVYGVPVRTWDSTGKIEGLSVDSFLASINAGPISQFLPNPYYAQWNEGRLHTRNFQNPSGWKMYIVTRLDGPSAKIALGLVDKAIRAEAALKAGDGIAYFDYRHIAIGDAYYPADQTVVNVYNLARGLGYQTVFNDNQSDNAKMIHNAPKTLWAWGWYSGPFTWDGYQFVEGAVGAQLTSYTANSIRSMLAGTWVPLWLNAGITATWGATTEPYTSGYANGDNLFNKFWSGYNFGESAYQATPFLNHAMVFVGDPLYAPTMYKPGKVALQPPLIVSAADGTTTIAPGSLASLAGSGLSNCTAANHAATLPLSLCGTSVTMNGQPVPLMYVSSSQINLLVPRGLQPGQDLRIAVTREDGQTGADTLPGIRFVGAAPGIFLSGSGETAHAIVQNPQFALAVLKPGDAAVLYASGLGPTDSAVADTASAPGRVLVRTLAEVRVWINGIAQNTFFAGFTPGQFGLYQVNFLLDSQTPLFAGDQNFVWLTVDDVESAHVRILLAT